VWTADSKGIIFETADPAAGGIYWMRSDGSGAPRILTKERWRPESVSPDGKWLLVIQFEELGRASILQAPIEGDPDHPALGKTAPFLTSTLSVLQTFSRDGRWVANITADPANRGIWVRPFPGPGGQWKIDSAGLQPVWSRTGNELFYMSVSDGRIMAVSYTANNNTFTWLKPHVWSERRLLDLGPYPTYDVAPDGKRLAVVLYEDGTAQEKPITHVAFLLNFFDELRRTVPLSK
jgi:Tol biopolymer transport system component